MRDISEEYIPILSGNASFKERSNGFIEKLDVQYSPEFIFSNFKAMSISFSLNHSCVVACLAYASAELGSKLSSFCSGTLYVSFALSAFLLSNPLVMAIGWSNGLMIGVFGYCIYVCGFLLSVITLNFSNYASWIIACTSAAIGGLAGGLLWTSQGRCFSRHSYLYSCSSGLPIDKINSDFAAIFATYYLGYFILWKLL